MPVQPTIVSFSELDTFRQCPLKHELAYKERWQPPTTAPALARGTLWHSVMEAHYTALMNGEGQRAALTAGYGIIQNTPQSETTDLLTWMYDGYTDLYSWDRGWEIIAVELPINVPLPTPSGHASRFILKGKVDLLVRERDTGDYWAVDHKTCRNLPNQIELDLDDQFGIYTWMLRYKYQGANRVRGVIHSAARTERLKRAMTPEERFRRTKTFRTDVELQTLVTEVYRTFKTAYAYKPGEAPRAPNTDTCRWRCPFTEACLMHRKTPDRDRAQLMRDWSFHQDWSRH